MKRLLLSLLLLTSMASAQTLPVDSAAISGSTATTLANARKFGSNVSNYRFQYLALTGKYVELVNTWQFNNYIGTATQAAINAGGIINGWTITSEPTIGQVITTGTPEQVFYQMYKQTQVPTASLSGGTTYELGITAATHNLSFSYGRQSATATISTAVIEPGTLSVYSTQPAQPGTVSGTQSVTTPSNTNRTYTLTVTTSDGKTATATTTDTWLPGRYWGRSSSATPDNAIILAVAGGDKSLSSSVAGTFTITASGSNYPFFAYPSSQSALTSIKDENGFEVSSLFTISTVSVTNVNGYTQNYRVYTKTAATAGNYQITTL